MEHSTEVKAYLKHQRKLMTHEYAKRSGSVAKALKEFKVPKATFSSGRKYMIKTGPMDC